MNERLNELRLDAGISQLHDDPRLVVIDRSGKVIDPLVGLEKFAQLIVREVFAKIEDERFEIYQPVKESVMKHFGVEE